MIKKIYQSVKYSFCTAFALAECIGIFSGIWAGLRTFFPSLTSTLKKGMVNVFLPSTNVTQCIEDITFIDQCAYAENALRMMGLTQNFSPLIVFCGHGSTTENNAYASALDCGACGGNHGSSNARILAKILNKPTVQNYLAKQKIFIPKTTKFLAAKHDTTTDEIILYESDNSVSLVKLKHDLEKARQLNNNVRFQKMERMSRSSLAKLQIKKRSQDWAQVRPEWGLARNAAFIVAPRSLTQSLDLEGRCFLHSYDYSQDPDGKYIHTILTAPMVVAQWINSQYFFSTINNTSFGAGSKVTKNITGKIGVMQGNASDLMTGLPLQSVYSSDKEEYHIPQRLLTIVHCPREKLDVVIQLEPVLQKLFGNGWVKLVCIEPKNQSIQLLERDFTWKNIS